MTVKFLGLAALATGCAISLAAAQTPPDAMAPAKPQDFLALLHPGVPQGGGHIKAAPTFRTGWNTQTCAYNVWYTDGAGHQYIYVFNTNNTYFYAINNLYAGSTLLQVCNTGQSYGVYIVNGNTGSFTLIQTKRQG